MPCQRHFLGWDQPILRSAADFLSTRYEHAGGLKLEDVVLVVPGRRAGDRLLALLLERAQRKSFHFFPPRIETGGDLPELLYQVPAPLANDAVQRLAWTCALRETLPEVLQLVAPHLPEQDATRQWQHLADTVRRLHTELAAEGLSFHKVARDGFASQSFHERPRWQALDEIYQRYLKVLGEAELCDPNTARLQAITANQCRIDKEIVLVGMADLNRVLVAMLQQVADRVVALIAVPARYQDRFDALGGLVVSAWEDHWLDIDDEQILLAQNANHQAEQVVQCVAEVDGRYAADEIAIGVPDERLAPHVARQLEQHGVRSRWYVGRSLPETRPYQMLLALRDYLAIGTSDVFAALVRHPDVGSWLTQQGLASDWLTELDSYLAEHLPLRVGERWLGDVNKRTQIERAHAALSGLLSEVATDDRRALAEWNDAIRAVLAEIYASVDAPDDRLLNVACQKVSSALEAISSAPPRIAPDVSVDEAIELVLEQLSREYVPAEQEPAAIEMLGWLELPLDDAPCLVVTSFNERFVPQSISGDLFLPDSLRRDLNINDNRRRFARDAYALDVLLHTREHLRLIVSRSDTQQNTLAPSRLLFATDGDTIARRVLRLYGRAQTASRPVGGHFISTRTDSDFTIPRPDRDPHPAFPIPHSALESLRVTDFKTYLACPYRFYLQRVLKLEPLDDRAVELDALQFGGLIHDVLEDFGKSDVKSSQNADEIDEFLQQRLSAHAAMEFGTQRRAVVNVQLRQMRQRLSALARWQAGWAAQGWQIKHVEEPADRTTPFEVDNKPFALAGRIDRIDQHPDGRYMILDYKTFAQRKTPDQTHRDKGQWVDLQLPLYRYIAASLGVVGDLTLGYIVLPEDSSKTGLLPAQWSEAELKSADELARDVVRRVRRREFWPPQELPPYVTDDFAAICMTGVFERPEV